MTTTESQNSDNTEESLPQAQLLSVTEARSRLGVICRTKGTPQEIEAARNELELAKARRLEADAQALRDNVRDRVLITQFGDEPIKENHNRLLALQAEETARFKAEHQPELDNGATKEWGDQTRRLWDAIRAGHHQAHRALGCSNDSSCTGTRYRG